MRILIAALLFYGAVISFSAVADERFDAAMAAWARTLDRFVDDQGRTDFKALAKEPQDLRLFIDYIESTSPVSHPGKFPGKDHAMAFHINAYNALAMFGVVEEGIPRDFSSIFKRASFFRFRKITIGNEKTSLHDYENKIIRPLNEPRSHFALNCMVRDCPRLPREPFVAASLDQQLDAASREFFGKQQHFRLDREKRIAYVSAILDFYTEDFVPSGKAADLPAYINPYLDEPIPEGYRIKFIKYDWTINQQPE